MPEEFHIVDCEENKSSRERLINLIKSQKAILFLGSGTSRNLGYPSWETLIRQVSSEITNSDLLNVIEKCIAEGDLLMAAEIARSNISDDLFFKKFNEIFKSKGLDTLNQKLVEITFKAFVTTNYDTVCEEALKAIQKPTRNYGLTIDPLKGSMLHSFIDQLINEESIEERYQLYLHGRYDNPNSIVFSYNDYSKKYDNVDVSEFDILYKSLLEGKINISDFEQKTQIKSNSFRTHHFKIIYLMFLTQKFVFVGFGLRDPYLLKIIEEFKDDFKPINANHFVLFSSEVGKDLNQFEYQEQREFWRERGINMVFYKDDQNFKGLERFLDEFPPECSINLKAKQEILNTRQDKNKENESNNLLKSKLNSNTLKIINEMGN